MGDVLLPSGVHENVEVQRQQMCMKQGRANRGQGLQGSIYTTHDPQPQLGCAKIRKKKHTQKTLSLGGGHIRSTLEGGALVVFT